MYDRNTSITKITRPNISGVLQRERLFTLLDKGSTFPVTWITGPGGAGKTTLAAGYLDSRGLPCLWYQVDEGDADIATFFYYINTAAQKIHGSRKKPLPPFTPECIVNLPVFTRRYFETLCGRLKVPFTIVLDNYQEAPAGSGFHDMIVHGLNAVPEGVNVTILSRNEPPSQYARMRANNRINIVGWEDLRFSLDESQEIVNMNNVAASAGAIAKLHEKTEGWAAGLVLMMECARRRRVDCEMLGDLTLPEVFDYFSNDILKKIDEETRVFLLKTAFLPSITAKSARKLTGLRDSDQILSRLNGSNYFTDMRMERPPVYQYHALFREYLIAAATRTFTKKTIAELSQNAAFLLEENGHIEDAAGLFLQSCNWKESARVICQHAQTFLSQGRSETVRAWLVSMPEEVLNDEPYLLYWLGACLASVDHVESRKKYEKAFEIFKAKNDRTGMLLSWSGAADLALFETLDSPFSEDIRPYDKWISIYEETLKSDEPFQSREVETRVTMSMFNAMALRQPDHPEIELWEERAFNLMRECQDANLRAICGPNLVLYYISSGNLTRATILIEMLRVVAMSGKISGLMMINIKATEAFYHFLSVSFEDGIEAMVEGLRLAEERGIHILDNLLLVHGISAAILGEHWKIFDKYFPILESNMDNANTYITGHYHALLSMRCMLLQGDYIQAKEHQMVVLTHFSQSRWMSAYTVSITGMVAILRQSGNLGEAEKYLSKAYNNARSMRSIGLEHLCLMYNSLLLFDRGDKETALARLREALEKGSSLRLVNLFWCRPEVQAQLCNEALKAGIEVEYVQYIIRKRRLLPPVSEFASESWPWPLKIYTLGGFELVVDGNPIKFPGKTPQKPLAMLKALVAFGCKASEEKLSDLLWPDADGDEAHIAFKTTLFRLRKLLGVDNAILFQEGMASVNRSLVWTDAWAFDELVGRTGQELNNTGAIELADKALALYKGRFLPGDSAQSWTIKYREQLHKKYLKLASDFPAKNIF